MNDVGMLAYLEVRLFTNRIAAFRASPEGKALARAAGVLLAVALLRVAGTLGRQQVLAIGSLSLGIERYSRELSAGALLTLLVWIMASRTITVRWGLYPADTMFLFVSRIDRRALAALLFHRKLVSLLGESVFVLMLAALLVPTMVRALLPALGTLVVLRMGLFVVHCLLGLGWKRAPAAMWALLAVAAVLLAESSAGNMTFVSDVSLWTRLALSLPILAAAGRANQFSALAFVVSGLVALVCFSCRNGIDVVEPVRQGRVTLARRGRALRVVGARSMIGAWAIAWKETACLQRSTLRLWNAVGGLAFLAAEGLVVAHLLGSERSEMGELVISVFLLVTAVFITASSETHLAEDLGKSLWWTGPDPLLHRLVAWLVANSAPRLIGFVLAVALLAKVYGYWGLGFLVAAGGVVILLLAEMTCLCVFASSSSQLYARGPGSLVRLVFSLVAIAAPVLVFAIALQLGLAVAVASAGGVAVSLLETWWLLRFAEARIAGNGRRYSLRVSQ